MTSSFLERATLCASLLVRLGDTESIWGSFMTKNSLRKTCVSAALIALSPALIMGVAVVSAYAQEQSAQPFVLAVPENARVTAITIWSDSSFNGLQLSYQVEGSSETNSTQIIGTQNGRKDVLPIVAADQFDYFTTFSSADTLSGIGLMTKFQGVTRGTTRGLRGSMTQLPAGSRFWGFTGTVGNTIQSLAFATSGTPAVTAVQPQLQASLGRRPTQQPTQPEAEPENPFADPAGDAGPSQSGPQPPSQPAVQPIQRRPRGTQTAQIPGSNSPAPQAQAPAGISATNSLDGAWTKIAEMPRRLSNSRGTSDQRAEALLNGRYIPPLTIKITPYNASETYLMVENVNASLRGPNSAEILADRAPVLGQGSFMFKRASENVYAREPDDGSRITIERGQTPLDDVLTLSMGPPQWRGLNQEFQRARLVDNLTLSRDRFDPEVLEGRLGRTDRFADVIEQFNPSITGWDITDMSPIDPSRGQMGQVFATPGAKEFTTDDYVAKGVPYGLRGIQRPQSSSNATKISVTSELETQAQTSMNMGVAIQGFGLNFSQEKAKGVRTTRSSSIDISMTRLSRYVAILDLPNQRLDSNFRRSLQKLIDSTGTADEVIASYGTHYANAITYGALGYTESATEAEEDVEKLSTKWNAGGEASARGVTVSGGGGRENSNSASSGSSRTITAFTAVGGSGTGNEQSFQANDADLIPILFDLRKISELINPIFFPFNPQVNNDYSAHVTKLLQARNTLENTITQQLANLPRLSIIKPAVPRAYRIRFQSLHCTAAWAQGTSVSLTGKLTAQVSDSLGTRDVVLFDQSTYANPLPTTKIPCGPSAAVLPLVQTAVLVTRANEAEKATLTLKAESLFDYSTPTTLNSEQEFRTNDFVTGLTDAVLGPSSPDKVASNQRYNRRVLLKDSIELLLNAQSPERLDNTDMFSQIPPSMRLLQGSNTVGRPSIVINYQIERLQ